MGRKCLERILRLGRAVFRLSVGLQFGNAQEDVAVLHVIDHFAGALEDELAPSFTERIGFSNDLDDFSFQFLLGCQKGVPQIVADRTFLKESLQRGFVFPESQNALDVRDGAAK